MDLQLTDRVFLVTGGARGLGRASADVLVAEGARVVVSGRSQESLDEARPHSTTAPGVTRPWASSPTTPTRDTPARLLAAADEHVGPARRRADQRRRSAEGPGHDDHRRAVDAPRSSRSSSAPYGSRARSARRCGGRLARPRAVVQRARAAARDGDLQRAAARPGDGRQDARRRARARAASGSTGCCPGRIATDRVAELDASTGDAEAAAAGGRGEHPAAALRRARRSSARWRRSCCRPRRHS